MSAGGAAARAIAKSISGRDPPKPPDEPAVATLFDIRPDAIYLSCLTENVAGLRRGSGPTAFAEQHTMEIDVHTNINSNMPASWGSARYPVFWRNLVAQDQENLFSI
jgi:hypothetical protein